VYFSPYRRQAPVRPTFMKFGIRGQVTDVFTCVKFVVNRLTLLHNSDILKIAVLLTCCVALTPVYTHYCAALWQFLFSYSDFDPYQSKYNLVFRYLKAVILEMLSQFFYNISESSESFKGLLGVLISVICFKLNSCWSKGQLLVFVFEPCCPAHTVLCIVLLYLLYLLFWANKWMWMNANSHGVVVIDYPSQWWSLKFDLCHNQTP